MVRACVCASVCMHAYMHVQETEVNRLREAKKQSERQREKHGVWGSHKTVSSVSDLIAFHGVLQ